MTPLELAIQSVHQLDLLELARVKATTAARIESLTQGPLPGSWLKRWWQRLTQPHHYAMARDKENRRLHEDNARLTRQLRRLKEG
jgi:hypothetical protein